MLDGVIEHLQGELYGMLDGDQRKSGRAAGPEGTPKAARGGILMTLEQSLRQASDTLMEALGRMQDLETEKRQVPAGSQRFVELAQKVDDLALQILRHTEYQESVADTLGERREAGGAVSRPIESIPPTRRDRHEILREWRDAERELVQADLGTTVAAEAASKVRALREEYRVSYQVLGDKPKRSP